MTRKADLETVRAAFRIAGLADGGIESFDDVGLELLWQIAEIRAQQERKPSDVALLKAIRESLVCAKPNTDWTFLVAAIDAAMKETQ